ncbi:hypothetical protein M513_03484 [Trichuris suis]|uniref:Uncharacterized protein n=1 Tax=Trichuris suis TaxID=68888 RepID=A0A085MEU0_9BILA|nr:hypothetical protein M513_03484 [Trichuris suis]
MDDCEVQAYNYQAVQVVSVPTPVAYGTTCRHSPCSGLSLSSERLQISDVQLLGSSLANNMSCSLRSGRMEKREFKLSKTPFADALSKASV